MSHIELNRSGEIEVFLRVVELGSLSAAGRALRLTPSAVSKLVTRLEDRLGTVLLRRTTRKLQVTAEGAAFYEKGLQILADLDEAEREASRGAAPRGRLRVNSFVPFGQHVLIPLIPAFQVAHPEVQVDLMLTDRIVDLLDERADVAIRAGPLADSRLTARKLGQSPMVLVAAPAYLEKHGTPDAPADLDRHSLIGFCFTRHVAGWTLTGRDGDDIRVVPSGGPLVSDGEAMRLLALAGGGIAQLARWHVARDMADGRLIEVMGAFRSREAEPVHAVYVGASRHLPARVRAFVDFLAQSVAL
ncbi:LysR family transcriptional regulator [Mesorhizobium sp. NBSH29]|uniref:LysR family transcriptional regulator n=1 Tax=Mesorhizobium sp. NBSH29 TaxID=2654249 RepID=UPI0018965E7B|nr:LysR family transcriptional regulator [Mesorhizobium sp. NBSH29]QPC85853.1 LysR family transcriptional regulator [Mesorhizobium sp. NBSH29]